MSSVKRSCSSFTTASPDPEASGQHAYWTRSNSLGYSFLQRVRNTIRGEDLASMVQFLIGSMRLTRVGITDGESAPAAAVQSSAAYPWTLLVRRTLQVM